MYYIILYYIRLDYILYYIIMYIKSLWNRPNVLAESSETISEQQEETNWTIMTHLQNTGNYYETLSIHELLWNSSTRHSPIMMIYDGYSLI